MRARARSLSSSLTSRPIVATPAWMHTCAMPAPIVPSPTTPTVRISRGTAAAPYPVELAHGRDHPGAEAPPRRRVDRDRGVAGGALALLRGADRARAAGRHRGDPPGDRRRRAGNGRSPSRPSAGGGIAARPRAPPRPPPPGPAP